MSDHSSEKQSNYLQQQAEDTYIELSDETLASISGGAPLDDLIGATKNLLSQLTSSNSLLGPSGILGKLLGG